MKSYALAALALATLMSLPAVAAAQDAAASAPDDRHTWIAAGGSSTTLLGDCTDCEITRYRHSGSVLVNGGMSINRRADFGAEVFWVPQTLQSQDRVRVTYLMASVQFRPWQTHGFFLKAGSGMAFIRNWLKVVEETNPPIRSKAFALAIGGGWEWMRGPMGFEIFGSQHVAALGDLQTSTTTFENVMANMWSVGGAVVIRPGRSR